MRRRAQNSRARASVFHDRHRLDKIAAVIDHFIEHVDGHRVRVAKTGISTCAEVLTIRGEGMPKKNGKSKGNMYVELAIDFPKSLSDAQKDHLRKALPVGA